VKTYCCLVLPVAVGGPPRGAGGAGWLWAVARAAWRPSFSDESALEVITRYALYKSMPLAFF